jgi:hypothetical protein
VYVGGRITTAAGTGPLVVKLANDVEVWLYTAAGPGLGGVVALVLDGAGNPVVTSNDLRDATGADWVVTKLAADSGAVVWRTVLERGGALYDYLSAVRLHPNGDVLVAGGMYDMLGSHFYDLDAWDRRRLRRHPARRARAGRRLREERTGRSRLPSLRGRLRRRRSVHGRHVRRHVVLRLDAGRRRRRGDVRVRAAGPAAVVRRRTRTPRDPEDVKARRQGRRAGHAREVRRPCDEGVPAIVPPPRPPSPRSTRPNAGSAVPCPPVARRHCAPSRATPRRGFLHVFPASRRISSVVVALSVLTLQRPAWDARRMRFLFASAALLVPVLAFGGDQFLVGRSLVVRSPPGSEPGYRKIVAKAFAAATLSGDPTTPANSAGAVLQIALDGGTPSSESFTLPQGIARDGKPFWRVRTGGQGFEYADRYGENGPVQRLKLKHKPSFDTWLDLEIRGAANKIDVAPPNPGTSGAVTLAFAAGDRYCMRFGPEADVRNDADRAFVVKRVLSAGCPDLVEGEFLALSYNVAGLPQGISSSDPEINTPLIAPLLNGYEVVVMQETWKTPDPNPFAPTRVYHEIIEAGADHRFKTLSATHPLNQNPERPTAILGDGLNTFSRFPFGDVTRVPWSTCHESAADCLAMKGFSMVRMTVAPGLTIDVYDLHMEAGGDPEDDVARDLGITLLSNFIQANSADRPVIVGGDFNLHTNVEPDSSQFQRLLSETGLQDVCATLACPEPGRIDKWLFRSAGQVTITPLSWDFETDVFVRDGNVPLSDHEPLAVRFGWAVSASMIP